jgi:translation initiation factor IF-2
LLKCDIEGSKDELMHELKQQEVNVLTNTVGSVRRPRVLKFPMSQVKCRVLGTEMKTYKSQGNPAGSIEKRMMYTSEKRQLREPLKD